MKTMPAIAVASLALLSACSNNTVKNTLGLDRAPPDEYRVVSRPPLSVPPQFTLHPPSATAQAPGQMPSSQQAESLVTGKPNLAATDPVDTGPVTSRNAAPVAHVVVSTGPESAFLKQAGADKADPTVRDKLVEEKITQQDQQEEKSWWDVFSSNPPPKETIVDANKESQRIKTNTDNGQSATAGDTAVVKQKDTGVLGQIFGY